MSNALLSTPPDSYLIHSISFMLNLFFLQRCQPLCDPCMWQHIFSTSRSASDFYCEKREKNIKKLWLCKETFFTFPVFLYETLAHFPFTRKFRQIKFFFCRCSVTSPRREHTNFSPRRGNSFHFWKLFAILFAISGSCWKFVMKGEKKINFLSF